MSNRILQINDLIRNELNNIILNEVDLPKGCLVTIIRVESESDLKSAIVYVSILPSYFKGKVFKLLVRKSKRLQHSLNRKIRIKFVPAIKFVVVADDKEQ
ncbi:ribosome-binding factor A [Candidatus Parcubacteria bacterium]|nr:ribosome-binding factor A [Candidatus Parcubacteria bacterium]